MEPTTTAAELSAVMSEEGRNGTSQVIEILRTTTLTPGGSENVPLCETFRRPQPVCTMGSTRAPQDMKPAEDLSQAAQQFSDTGLKVARSFFLPLKRTLYRYIYSLRTLLSCPVEILSQSYPPLRLLQSERQQLQVTPFAQTCLPCLYTAAAGSVHGNCTLSSNLSSECVSYLSLEASGSLSDNSVFTSFTDVPAASAVEEDYSYRLRSDLAVAIRKSFAVHITNILEAETVDELLPYLEIFEPCLKAAISPAALKPRACALLCGALRHVEQSGYSVSASRCKRRADNDVLVPSAVSPKRARAGCTSGTCEAAPISTTLYSSNFPPDGASHLCNGAQFDTRTVLHGRSESGALHTVGEQQTTVSRHTRVLHTCEEGRQAVPETACGTPSNVDTGNPLGCTCTNKSSSLSASGLSCVASSPPSGTRRVDMFSINIPFVAGEGTAKNFSGPQAAGPEEDKAERNGDSETAAANYEFPLPIDGDAWSRITGRWNFPAEEISNKRQQTYRRRVRQDSARLLSPMMIDTYIQSAGHCNGEKELQHQSIFFLGDTIDDPQLEKVLERAKHICLQHLHWLRRLVPTWSGKAYQEHTTAILGARNLPDLTNYLIVFANLESDVQNQLPVSVASLMECLKELEIIQHGYASCTLPRGLLHSCNTLTASSASVLGKVQGLTKTILQDSHESVSSFFPLASSARMVASQADATYASTGVILSSEDNCRSCASSPIVVNPLFALPVAEGNVASELLSYSLRQRGTTDTSSHCQDAAAAPPQVKQQSAKTNTLRSSDISRTNCRSWAPIPAARQSSEPALLVAHTRRKRSDLSGGQLYEKEVQVCLKRVAVEGDSWLLQPKYTHHLAAVDRTKCESATCSSSGNKICRVEDAEEHGSCSPSFSENSYRTRKSFSRQRKTTSDLQTHQRDISDGKENSGCTGDSAGFRNSTRKNPAGSNDDTATGGRNGAANCGSVASDAELSPTSLSEKDIQRCERIFPEDETCNPRNDYVTELLMLLEDSQLPCYLQEELYAEISQYVSAPAISPAQWRQVVWKEAQQRQQEQQMRLQLEERQQQVKEEQVTNCQERRLGAQIAKEYAKEKQCKQQSGSLDGETAEKENVPTGEHKRGKIYRQKRSKGKRKRINRKSSCAGKKISAGNNRSWRAVARKNKVLSNFRGDSEKKKALADLQFV